MDPGSHGFYFIPHCSAMAMTGIKTSQTTAEPSASTNKKKLLLTYTLHRLYNTCCRDRTIT